MRKTYLWMPAAILCCSLVTTSCTDVTATPDNPSTTPEQASAVDQGKWWIDDSYMDKTVKPGDNFFMYCNGTWWKNTSVSGSEPKIIGRLDGQTTLSTRASQLTDANYQQYQNRLVWAEDGSKAATAGQKAYDDVLAKSGLNDAKTPEDVLRAFGKMSAMGVASCLWLQPFAYHGKICLYVTYSIEEKSTTIGNTSSKPADLPSDIDFPFRQMVKNDPELLAHLVPLAGKSGTRTVPDAYSGMRYIVEGMGIDPTYVYLKDDYLKNKNLEVSEDAEEHKKNFRNNWQMLMTADQAVEKLKKKVMDYYYVDRGFVSKKAKAEYEDKVNTLLPEPGDLFDEPTKADEDMYERPNLDELKKNMNRYLYYLRSKMVADQLVPKGQKEEYQKNFKELKEVFAQRIKDNDWLSDGSKKNALEKLDAMVFNVCYPDKWIEAGLPDFSKNTSLVEDIYAIRKARLELLKAIVGKSRQEGAFTAIAMDELSYLGIENAFYDPNLNAMNMIPYYMLPPFFDPTQSIAINYSAFGTPGHEMTHGFDSDGSKFDKNGDYTPKGIWASDADKSEFDRRSKLLVDYYASFDVLPEEMPGVKAVGDKTLPENIADLGGLEIAWQAYVNRLKADGYTGDQLKLMKQRFFRAYADEWRAKYNAAYVNHIAFGVRRLEGPDVHSMNKERVNGVVANMDGWYDAFDIKEGALYRKPADRIRIW